MQRYINPIGAIPSEAGYWVKYTDAEALNARLVKALVLAEWGGDFDGEWHYCPVCGGRQDQGHAKSCEISAALARTPPQKPAAPWVRDLDKKLAGDPVYEAEKKALTETPARFVCKGCGKEMDPAYEAVWSGGTARHWDVKAQAWCGPVEKQSK